jgi:hypothetical protein
LRDEQYLNRVAKTQGAALMSLQHAAVGATAWMRTNTNDVPQTRIYAIVISGMA